MDFNNANNLFQALYVQVGPELKKKLVKNLYNFNQKIYLRKFYGPFQHPSLNLKRVQTKHNNQTPYFKQANNNYYT